MLFEEISLTPQDILDKEFKIDARGFRITEVDAFLDTVIKDYIEFTNYTNALKQENEDLQNEIIRLQSELRRASDIIETFKGADKSITNVDLMKRLSNLEKYVYGDEK